MGHTMSVWESYVETKHYSISLYKEDSHDGFFLGYLIDPEAISADSFMNVHVTKERLEQFENDQIDLHTLLLKPEDGCVYITLKDGGLKRLSLTDYEKQVTVKQLPVKGLYLSHLKKLKDNKIYWEEVHSDDITFTIIKDYFVYDGLPLSFLFKKSDEPGRVYYAHMVIDSNEPDNYHCVNVSFTRAYMLEENQIDIRTAILMPEDGFVYMIQEDSSMKHLTVKEYIKTYGTTYLPRPNTYLDW